MKKNLRFLVMMVLTVFVFMGCPAAPTVETYTVSFDSDGGTAVASQTIEEGKTAVEPDNPAKSGYEFGGWYDGESKFDFSTKIYKDYSLKANWSLSDEETEEEVVLSSI